MNYFYFTESPIEVGKYVLKADIEKLGIKSIGRGSLNVLPARILDISYPNFLRLCRDSFGATIVGKGQLYPTVYFTSKSQKLLDLLSECIEDSN